MGKAFFLLFFLYSVARAQPPGETLTPSPTQNFVVRQYNTDNGLPQSSAKDLLLDQNHFLWIATENGLVRFDGQRFHVYSMSNTPVLRTNRFAILSANVHHEVLIRSEFDPDIIFKVQPDYRIVVDTLLSDVPHKLMTYHSNGVFDAGPLFIAGAAGVGNIDTTLLNGLLGSSSYWIMSENEAVIRMGDDWYFLSRTPARMIRMPVAPGQGPISYAFFKDDLFCILGGSGGQFFRHGRQVTAIPDRSIKPLLDRIAGHTSGSVGLYTKGDLVIARVGNDIYKLRMDADTLKADLLFTGLTFLEDQPSYAFQYDSLSGKLFVGTASEGLYIVSPRQFHALNFPVKDFMSNVFMACLPLSGGRILTSNGILAPGDRRKDVLFGPTERPDRNCFFRARDGRIWLSLHKRLLIYDSSFSHPVSAAPYPMDSYVSDILERDNGEVWVSSLFSIWKYKDSVLQPVMRRIPLFLKHTIETIAEVVPGKLWIGSRDGIFVLDMATGRLDPTPLLPHVYARNIFRAQDASSWIGTYGNGYFKYMDGRFISLPLDAHKYLQTAHCFLEDDKGFFWISTNHGLFRVRKSELDAYAANGGGTVFFEYFDKSFGFNTNEFNGGANPAAFEDGQGRFYFPSLDGLVWFHPDSIRRELSGTRVLIDDLQVDSARWDPAHPRLSADFNLISGDVSTPYYGLEDNLHLEYLIEPMGKKWYPIGSDGKIVVNRLPYGHYALHVRAWRGPEEQSYSAIDFEVLPHWYNTSVFFILLTAVFCFLAFLVYKLRTRWLLRTNMKLQEKVEERTRELEESSFLKESLVSVIMHDLRSPLFSMSLLIDHLITHHKRMTPPEMDNLLGQVGDANKDLCRFSNDFLAWYNTHKEGFMVRKESLDLQGFVHETAGLYHDIARRKGLGLMEEIPAGLLIYSDRNMLAVIVRNLLDNAIKYTRKGSVRISAGKTAEGVLIRISDTGIGMTAEKIEHLLSKEKAVDATSSFGYRFIVELLRPLDGRLGIESVPAQGTVVTILLGVP